jgi:cytoskeleton protein RodZ
VATSGIPAAPDTLLPDDDSRQPRVYGVENETARIILRARLDSWVQVYAADESLILTRVLQPGDSYRVPDLAGLTLVTGNAGGLEIEVDGAIVPPLGPVGAIRRGIALDAERLLEGTALAQ